MLRISKILSSGVKWRWIPTVVGILLLVLAPRVASSRDANSLEKSFWSKGVERFWQEIEKDTSDKDTLPFPIYDRRGGQWTLPRAQGLDFSDPSSIRDTVIYDPITGQYQLEERNGNQFFRAPSRMSSQEYLKMRGRQQEQHYWRERRNTFSDINRSKETPGLYYGPKLFDRVFGGTATEIYPQGNMSVTMGYEGQNFKNPILPERARKTGGFDFDMDINMNIQGQIGDKLRLTSTYNTQSVFDFDKQIKLEYTGDKNSIIQKIEAGNVSFPLRSQLINGVQSLFGIKTQLQFGRLMFTGIFSTQRSQKQNIMVEGGSQTYPFTKQADQYQENQHFFFAQYFREHFNEAMASLPIMRSQVHINRVQVWITNKRGSTIDAREVVGLMDLGEQDPYNGDIQSLTSDGFPRNESNDEYSKVASNGSNRNPGLVVSRLQALGLRPVRDFEKTYARLLDSTEYTVNREIGYISLNRSLLPDEVLAVAFQYTVNGQVYQVGEFADNVPPSGDNVAQPQMLFLKLLKATSARPALPIWDLMMKNIYSLDNSQVNRDGFRLDIYYQDPGGGEKRYLPDAQGDFEGKPLLSILNLDRLNSSNDPQPDGVFDFVEGYTINSRKGIIIFPVLEPFGEGIAQAFPDDPSLADKYEYRFLYDSTITVARQFPQFNRFVLRGSYKSSSSSDIDLGAFNIPEGSVTVTGGGQQLIEGVDYEINYSMGSVHILNEAILNSGRPINIRFENNAMFGQQTRNYFGARFDYMVDDHLTLGASMVRMTEKPYFNVVDYGNDPIANTIGGFDLNYRDDLPKLTQWLNKLPNLKTDAPSSITASAEVAKLFPGHSKLIGKGSKGAIYIDDFEGASTAFDLRFPFTSWSLASTPLESTNELGNVMFPEADLKDSLDYGFKRAKLAWYTIEPSMADGGSNMPNHLRANKQSYLSHYVRLVKQQEVFPQQSVDLGQGYLTTLDLAYYPDQRGPYNYVTDPTKINSDGRLNNPKENWGGVMRALENTDFEASNVQYIEFWVMDPFLDKPGSSGGDLYINLGDVSEDILKDGKMFFENGLPQPSDLSKIDTSEWGRVPRFQEQITNAFDNDPAARAYQDVGLDGMANEEERIKRAIYLQALLQNFGAASKIYLDALDDPSNDDYHFYRGDDYDEAELSILERYKRFNNPEGNSPSSSSGSQFSEAATNRPETEDLNRDNTLNETEEYFQYRVHFKPNMEVGSDYVVDKMVVPQNDISGPLAPETWYQFRIPISQYDKRVGSIPDFKSIRFMRMFLTDFEDSVVLRFASMGLVRNQWRTYLYDLDTAGTFVPIDEDEASNLTVSSINLEENGARSPVPYMIPPGIQRQSQLSQNNVNLFLNEQSLSLKIKDLKDGKSRAVFKELGMDLRKFRRIQMFIHAESIENEAKINDGEVQAVIRLGSDFVNNYYEYRIPLKITDPTGILNPNTIWPEVNELDLDLDALAKLKQVRNQSGASLTLPYTVRDERGNYMSVVGNPSLGEIKQALLGVLNPAGSQTEDPDDGFPKSTEVWFDEFRVSDIDEHGGYAAMGRMDLTLADLGSISVAGAMHTAGFGNVDQQINQRFRDDFHQYDISTNLELGKLLPGSWNLSIPVYAGFSQTISNPEYDPYDLDIKLKDKLNLALTKRERDSILNQAQDYMSIASLNFTNVRKLRNPDQTTNRLWDPSNFNVSYSFSRIMSHNPLIQSDILTRHQLGLGYQFEGESKFIAPFRNVIGGSPYLRLIRDFNFNPIPSLVSVRAEIDRQFGETNVRNIGGAIGEIPATFDKYFTFDRYYNLHWKLTQSIDVDFQAYNSARVDEPNGRIDTKSKRDSVWQNMIRFGRPTLFQQSASVTYAMPFQKFPLLDWVTVQLGVSTNYNWTAASLLAPELGNIIQNGNQQQINANLNLNGLYNKIPLLKEINNQSQRRPNSRGRENQNQTQQQSSGVATGLRVLLTPVMLIKRVAVNYNENASTFLPGYLNNIGFMGQNWHTGEPGVRFAFGWQPDEAWLDDLGARKWITMDSTLNVQYRQQFVKKMDIQASLEPIPSLRIDLTMTKSYSRNHSELFKSINGDGIFGHFSPYDAGGFEVSYFSMRTLFDKLEEETGISSTYKKFEANREVISERLGELNPYTNGAPDPQDPDYSLGYGQYAQDVLIPAFLSAYTGKDPKKIELEDNKSIKGIRDNPFKSIKSFPNWNIQYNGLSNLPFFRKFVNNLTISHGYNSLLSMNSFSSSLFYRDPLAVGFPGFIDDVSGSYVPYFLIPNITIAEQLSPLLGVDATFTNSLSLSLSYGRSRTLSLSLIDYQLTETRSTRIDLGGGYRVRGFPLPFNIGRERKLQNDLNFRLDMSINDSKTVNNRIDADMIIPTNGTKVITISPSVDYVVNNRVNLHFFMNKRTSTPFVSTAFPMSNTEAGITIRYVMQ